MHVALQAIVQFKVEVVAWIQASAKGMATTVVMFSLARWIYLEYCVNDIDLDKSIKL